LVSVFTIGGWVGRRGAERAKVAGAHHGDSESCGTCLSHCGKLPIGIESSPGG
jgi:hypothetical protein